MGVREKGKGFRSWTSKGSCSKGVLCSFEHYISKERKAKDEDQEPQLSGMILLSDSVAQRRGRSLSGREDRPPCCSMSTDRNKAVLPVLDEKKKAKIK